MRTFVYKVSRKAFAGNLSLPVEFSDTRRLTKMMDHDFFLKKGYILPAQQLRLSRNRGSAGGASNTDGSPTSMVLFIETADPIGFTAKILFTQLDL